MAPPPLAISGSPRPPTTLLQRVVDTIFVAAKVPFTSIAEPEKFAYTREVRKKCQKRYTYKYVHRKRTEKKQIPTKNTYNVSGKGAVCNVQSRLSKLSLTLQLSSISYRIYILHLNEACEESTSEEKSLILAVTNRTKPKTDVGS